MYRLKIFYTSLISVVWASALLAQAATTNTPISKDLLQQAVHFLSLDSLQGRLTGSKGIDYAANFIARRFDSLGLKTINGIDGYFDHFTANYNREKIPAKNVVGAIPGNFTNDTVVIFSAHYDHIGTGNALPYNKEFTSKDDIFNGANDNATGVAALLELARYYQSQKNNRYQLLFIAFSGEEMEMLGSNHFMEKRNAKTIKAVINLEMLGRPAKDNCFIISFRNNSVKKLLNNALRDQIGEDRKPFFRDDPYPEEELSRRSDHYPFALKIKNGFTIMATSPEDIYYHSIKDEYQTIDFDFLVKATNMIALACEQFIR
ncbi:MAG: M20/M25/M40 family metallo-hydrolase [Ferruginibacter sp.]